MYPKRFRPQDVESPYGGGVYLGCPGSKRKYPRCKAHVGHLDCIVIAIEGACSNNGNPDAVGAIGVYCGDESIYNTSRRLDDKHERHTSQIAKLEACLDALRKQIDGERLNLVVIKSDSEYVARGLTEWLPRWKKNGCKNSRGSPVANKSLFQSLEEKIEVVESQVNLKFWLVARTLNCAADRLANDALVMQAPTADRDQITSMMRRIEL